MTQKNSIYFLRISLDLLLINVSFVLSATFAQSFEMFSNNELMLLLMLLLNFSWLFNANIFELYGKYSWQFLSYDIVKVIKVVGLQVIIAILFLFVIKELLFLRNFILHFALITLVSVSIKKIIFKKILSRLSARGFNVRNVLIVGDKSIGDELLVSLRKNFSETFNVIGIVGKEENNPNYLGCINELENLIQSRDIQDVIIAFSDGNVLTTEKVIHICNSNAVRTHIVPDYYRFVATRFNVSMLDNFPIITLRNEPLSEFHARFVKRAFDILISIFVITFVFTWLFPIIIIIQKLTSPGKVFFIQSRVGLNNQNFNIYKFRTMHLAQEKSEKPRIVTENDKRITKFGKFLRKTNLDELPQFFNTLKGSLSLVGPRPFALEFNESYNKYVSELKLRYLVKPGISGWAQIHGLRGDSPVEEENQKLQQKRFNFDMWYIENWSFGLDIQIILLTVWQMIQRKNIGT